MEEGEELHRTGLKLKTHSGEAERENNYKLEGQYLRSFGGREVEWTNIFFSKARGNEREEGEAVGGEN